MPVKNESVVAGGLVTMPCNVAADRYATYSITWLKDGQPIDYEASGGRYRLNLADNSLKIDSSKVGDTGRYKCRAATDLDEAELEGELLVRGRLPDVALS